MNRDVPFIGFIFALLFPLLGFYIMSLAWGHGMNVIEFWMKIKADNKIAAKVYTMSLLINFVPFLYFKGRKLFLTMNGVVVGTMLYVVYILLLMFVWS